MNDFINRYFGKFNTKATPKHMKNTLKYMENFNGNRSNIKKHIENNLKIKHMSEQILTGNSQHVKAVSSYFKFLLYDTENNKLFYNGPISFPSDLNLNGYINFARDLPKGIIALLTGIDPEICLEKCNVFCIRAAPYQVDMCDFDSILYIPLVKRCNIGSRIYIKAIKDVSLARVLIELGTKTWTSFSKILEIVVNDIRQLVLIEDMNIIRIIFDNDKKKYLQGTKQFFSGRKAADNIDEGLTHVGKAKGSISSKGFNLDEAFDYMRKVIGIWIQFKHNINIFNFLLFNKETKREKISWFNVESIQIDDKFQLEATIIGDTEDLMSLSNVFCNICRYDAINKKILYNMEFDFSDLEKISILDFFNEEKQILEGIMILLTGHIHLISMKFCFKDFVFKDATNKIIFAGEVNQTYNLNLRTSMYALIHVHSSGEQIYKIIRKNEELLKIIKLFSRGWSWDNFANICEIIEKNNLNINNKDIEWINGRSNNSTMLYDGGRHMKYNDRPESPVELGRAFDIIQEETIKWIKLRLRIDVQRSNIDLTKISMEKDIEYIERMSHTQLHELFKN